MFFNPAAVSLTATAVSPPSLTQTARVLVDGVDATTVSSELWMNCELTSSPRAQEDRASASGRVPPLHTAARKRK